MVTRTIKVLLDVKELLPSRILQRIIINIILDFQFWISGLNNWLCHSWDIPCK